MPELVPTVYLIEDDQAMRRSTCLLLEGAGLKHRAFASATDFIDEFRAGSPGCMILDLHLAGLSGIELLQWMNDEKVSLPVVVVSGTGTIPIAVEGMRLGIADFLEKPIQPSVLLEKVYAAIAVDCKRRAWRQSTDPISRRLAMLTPRERELLDLIVAGKPNKLIARDLHISIKTVENHRASLMQKIQASNVADLVRMQMLTQLKIPA